MIANEKFEILEKKDILINPEHAFKLGRDGFDPQIHLAYTEAEFCNSPTFEKRYEELKALLTRPDQIILGHSISSDLEFLQTAYKRYHRKRLEFDVYDTQKFFAKFNPNYLNRSLENMLKDLSIDATLLTEHKSCDDAEKSMQVVKEICKLQNKSIEELIRQNADCIVNYKMIRIVHDNSRIGKRLKNLRKNYKGSTEWEHFYFSRQIKMRDFEKRMNLIKVAYQNGYGFTTDFTRCTYIVVNHGMDATEQLWYENLSESERPKIISIREMSDLLKININQFGEIAKSTPKKDCTTSLKEAFENARKGNGKQRKRNNG
ncbi:MAG: hypothetical protein K2M95_07820 [Clostridiales bacterium]|nr:hypothetical protein [Clostridiales bacterium]